MIFSFLIWFQRDYAAMARDFILSLTAPRKACQIQENDGSCLPAKIARCIAAVKGRKKGNDRIQTRSDS
jgi:hypothetical protein